MTGLVSEAVAPATAVKGKTPKLMKAAMIVEFNKPLKIIDDAPVPQPGPNQILVRITASSLCMSDIMGYQGLTQSPLPYCGGHEPVGVVEGLGPGVVGFKAGDRVGFMPASRSCQDCPECLSGNHRFCAARTSVGFSGPYGGFSEYCLSDPLSTVKIPDGISDEAAAPLFCAGVTAYGAVKKAAQRQVGGSVVNIIGCGGVGHLAIMYAKAMGFSVTSIDIADEKLELATRCGADVVINSLKTPKQKIPQAATTIVISGATQAYSFALDVTQNHGTIIGVGVPHGLISCDMTQMILRDVSLIPTNQGSKLELYESLQLAALKGIEPVGETKNIKEINQGYEDMKAGKIVGRIVYTFD